MLTQQDFYEEDQMFIQPPADLTRGRKAMPETRCDHHYSVTEEHLDQIAPLSDAQRAQLATNDVPSDLDAILQRRITALQHGKYGIPQTDLS